MQIRQSDWQRYIRKLAAVDQAAADQMRAWMSANPTASTDELIAYAYAVATRYGEASAALACEMYDAAAAAQGASVPPAEPAPTATYQETAKAVQGTLKNQRNSVPVTVSRLTKQAGADTMLHNSRRDGAEFAWVPMGDTCPFCIMLASNGWQRQSKKGAGHHAEHIHANCDCTYAVRFDGKSTVQGYDPDKYLRQYEAAEGDTWQEKLNSMRRDHYAENREKINEQKRIAYEARKGLNTNRNTGIINTNLPDAVQLPDVVIGRSVGAKSRNVDIMDLQTGEHFSLVDGTRLQDVEVFAGKGVRTPFRRAEAFSKKYGGDPDNWQHVKGIGTVDYYGESRDAAIHWSQCEGIGKVEFFIKEWLE